MLILRNILAVFGAFSLVTLICGLLYVKLSLSGFTTQAPGIYAGILRDLMKTRNPAEATVWKTRVADTLDFDTVDQAIRALAHENSGHTVDAMMLGNHVAQMQDAPWRRLTIYFYCNPMTAAHLIEYSAAFAAYMPCRLALLEDTAGDLWLYSINLDMLIDGGRPLPRTLHVATGDIREMVQDIMQAAAAGDL